MPATLAKLALYKTATSIGRFHSLIGLPEELALALFELVLAKGKLTERSLKLFLDLVEDGRAREIAKQREQEGDGGDLFGTASFDDDDDLDAADKSGAALYSSLGRRIASLRLQLPPPVVPTGTGRWLGDLPPPWR
jgi:hypothetical protein